MENYEELSRRLADILVATVINKKNAAIIIATGSSPLLAYRLFVKRVKEEKIDVSKVTFIKLDEWVGLSPECQATCEYFIRQELLKPLNIAESAYIGFDCEAKDLEKECIRIQEKLNELKGIDLAILGVGKNGHLGLNEPDDYLVMGPHLVTLDEKTKTHAMLTEADKKVDKGITLGIADLFAAEKIILLISGAEKEQAVREFYGEHISTRIPVTLLKLHKNLVCIVEKNVFHIQRG
jgi:galactosamine-6-phosphate isomerase